MKFRNCPEESIRHTAPVAELYVFLNKREEVFLFPAEYHCRISEKCKSAPLMKKERNYAIIKDEKDPILFQLRSDDYGIFDQSYTLSCS